MPKESQIRLPHINNRDVSPASSLNLRTQRPSQRRLSAVISNTLSRSENSLDQLIKDPEMCLPTSLVKDLPTNDCGNRPPAPLPPGALKSKPDVPDIIVDPPKDGDESQNKRKSDSSGINSPGTNLGASQGSFQRSPSARCKRPHTSSSSTGDSPLTPDDGFFEDSDDDDSSNGNEPWDMPNVIPKERVSAGDSFQNILKFIRLFMYIAIFLLVLSCATASMGSVLLLTAAMRKDELYRHTARNQLTWIICFPQILTFLSSFFKAVFGNYPRPSFKVFVVVLILELVHVLGLVLIFFHVLPHFSAIYSMGLLHALSFIPGLLSLFFNGTLKGKSMLRTIIVKCLDVLAVLATVAAIVLPLIMGTQWEMNLRWSSEDDSTNQQAHDLPNLKEKHLNWQIPLGFIFVSVKWWENFVGLDRGRLRLYQLKKAVHNARNKLNVFISILSMLFTFIFVWLLDSVDDAQKDFKEIFDPTHHQTLEGTNCQEITGNRNNGESDEVTDSSVGKMCVDSIGEYVLSYIPVIVCAGSSLIMYYCCGLATKLLMQRFSCALPLLLSTPVLAVLGVLQCRSIIPELPITYGMQFEILCGATSGNHVYYIVVAVFCWLSLLWTTRHIWFPKIERLSYYERMFITRMFTGPLATQCIMLNRRNDEQDVNIVGKARNEELDLLYKQVNGSRPSEDNPDSTKKNSCHPAAMIYACATMWHENRNEMVQLLKSVFRMDSDYCARRIAKNIFHIQDHDQYEFETHVLFDDAMDLDDDDKWTVNKFVLQLKDCMSEAASAVLHQDITIPPPVKCSTPYGGRLTWDLYGGTRLVIHLKDKNKIRHRKRWSQVMYMYYLLGYRLFDEVQETKEAVTKNDSGISSRTSGVGSDTTGLRSRSVNGAARSSTDWAQTAGKDKGQTERFMKSEIFKDMEESLLVKTENTFILALDGDVDFKPDAVRLLVDRMRINQKTGAACGRIHPIGSSPMVWYQKFEYAIGHWFQKSTEHVLGCVLCSPGCFSLFRASALLDDNVMKRYTTEPTEAGHYLQYDQGEDRWLCTLLLQQGYRVDYAAASDALTYAPETFDEFFNQRRRWTPSTIANIIDLLSDSANTVLVNPNISFLYIVYQFFLMVSTVLGPATIILAIASAFKSVFGWKLWECYLASLAPVFFYLIICFKCKTKTQLLVGAFLSVMYAAVMTVVLVGIIQAIVLESVLNPSLLFLVVVVICFLFAGLIHPYEFSVLIHGILYFLCIPAGYLVLMIYSLCNLNNVSWGTREIPKRKSKAQQAAEAAAAANATKEKPKKQGGWFSFLKIDAFMDRLQDILTQVLNKKKDNTYQEKMIKMMKRLDKSMKRMVKQQKKSNGFCVDTSDSSDDEDTKIKNEKQKPDELLEIQVHQPESKAIIEDVKLDDPENPNWIKDHRLGNGKREYLSKHEEKFWIDFIRRYLKPLKKDAAKEKQLAAELLTLRNNSAFGFWFVNFLWVLFNYMIQKDSNLSTIKVGSLTTEPIGFVFLIFFLLVLVLQMVGMIIHRWGTLLQLISITVIRDILSKAFAHSKALLSTRTDGMMNNSTTDKEKLIKFISQMQHIPEPDYPTESNEDSIYAEVQDFIKEDNEKRTQTSRDHRNHIVHMDRHPRDLQMMIRSQRPQGITSHRNNLRRNLKKSISLLKYEEERRKHIPPRHRTKHHFPEVPSKARRKSSPNILDPGRRPSVDASHLREGRRPSQPQLQTLHEHRDKPADHMQGRSPKPSRKYHQQRHLPRHSQGRPLLERQFVRKFHRMTSIDDSRV